MISQCASNRLPLEDWAIASYIERLVMALRVLNPPVRGKRHANDRAWVILWYAEQELDKRIGTMATKKADKKNFKFEGWVNINLSDDDKGQIEGIAPDISEEQLLGWVGSMAYHGYSFSASWDDWSDSQQVSLVCKNPDDQNYGLGLSSRHPDIDTAILTLYYKHEKIAEGVWSNVAKAPRSASWG